MRRGGGRARRCSTSTSGLGGRKFGTWISWFLIGGDLYTAYTFVAVPALMFGTGATGFLAVPYTVVLYPLVFLVLIRLWSVSHRHGFVTSAGFVRSRFDSRTLALMLYPHSTTAILAAKSRAVVKRNMALLPLYSLMLGFLSLLGFMAIASGITPVGGDGNTVVPALFDQQFPGWFAGVAFAAIGIGALGFILFLNPSFAIDLQLIGGVIILQRPSRRSVSACSRVGCIAVD
ncbi:MAG: hypothetical protein ACR2KG_08075 [Nocardioidaceae bacterium]